MRRLSAAFGGIRWPDQAIRLARWQNPVVASPAAPLETFAALDALGPSLMPRTSRLQGVVDGAERPRGAGRRPVWSSS